MRYYKVKEVAKLLDLHPKTVRRKIINGEIKAIRFGERSTRISQLELDKLTNKGLIRCNNN